MPDVTERGVPNAGHAAPWDNHEIFERAIRECLADLPRSTAVEQEPPVESGRGTRLASWSNGSRGA